LRLNDEPLKPTTCCARVAAPVLLRDEQRHFERVDKREVTELAGGELGADDVSRLDRPFEDRGCSFPSPASCITRCVDTPRTRATELGPIEFAASIIVLMAWFPFMGRVSKVKRPNQGVKKGPFGPVDRS
jgi:hypothetical protein